MKAILTNIQRFSIHDGAGIRTTFFFKGCPLSCTWCANPETQNPQMELSWDGEKCVHCLSCVHSCAQNAIQIEDQGIRHERENCQHCGACIAACPNGALQWYGKSCTVEELVAEALRDKDYYEDSGGGVTLSGGEFLMQAEFSVAFADALHREGIHVAGETSGLAAPENFERVLASVDFLYMDLKHYDREKHREVTGVLPDLIWQNLRTLAASGKEFCIRIPVIPSVNDTEEDAAGFSQELLEFGIHQVQLLPFHSFGQKKYDTLGRKYDFADRERLDKEKLETYRNTFQTKGVEAFF